MIVILTGAGISQESGIATFRDQGGLWENESIEAVATPGGFARDPERVLEFYNQRRRELLGPGIAPNAAHLALARLEAEYQGRILLITQNVDNLHERAGSRNLLHMHGEMLKIRCTRCGAIMQWEKDLHRGDSCPVCAASGGLRPHIVWFEEMPLYMDEIDAALGKCRLFVSIGTSGNVYPAAGFVRAARRAGAHTVELNLERSQGANSFDEGRYGRASQVVPQWVEEVLVQHQN
ncbi:MAG: NAD-dependent protein deacylase [Deltaproteobacteria bacterium]|jgi:NAD-dependent deacetylase|nr:NAD-dependent protein deacylase [Deltaproteobacteria bacterium]